MCQAGACGEGGVTALSDNQGGGGVEVHWVKEACTTPVALGAADGTGTPLGHGKGQVKAGVGFPNL